MNLYHYFDGNSLFCDKDLTYIFTLTCITLPIPFYSLLSHTPLSVCLTKLSLQPRKIWERLKAHPIKKVVETKPLKFLFVSSDCLYLYCKNWWILGRPVLKNKIHKHFLTN